MGKMKELDIQNQDKKVQEEKLRKYIANEYSIPAPPVGTTWWGAQDWIRYIDKEGRWHD